MGVAPRPLDHHPRGRHDQTTRRHRPPGRPDGAEAIAQLFASYNKPTSSTTKSKKDDTYRKQESHGDNKYDHDYKMKKDVAFARTYKHEPQYYEEEYYRPIYQVYEVPKYDHRGANRRPVSYGDGGEPHSYRQKRSERSKAREER